MRVETRPSGKTQRLELRSVAPKDRERKPSASAEKANYCACLTGAVVGLFKTSHI
nr:MAG TPA: hypothetical protein [Caudoviricetes sp.]